jgi:hypothetical protein
MGRNVDIEEVRDMRDQINRAMVDMRDQILRVVDTGFKGTHHRQDITNGRVGKLEEKTGRFDERLEAVESDADAFHLHRRATDPPPVLKSDRDESGDDRRITQRDVRWVALGAGGAIGLVKLLPWLVSLAQAKP